MTHLELDELGPMTLLASGGEAMVYRLDALDLGVPGQQYAFKRYRNENIPLGSLDRIAAVPGSMPENHRRLLLSQSMWPIAVVRDGARAAGVIMPLIPDDYYHEVQLFTGTERITLEAQHLLVDEGRNARIGLDHADLHQRVVLCRGIAQVFALLHHHQVVFGDVNSRNILYRLVPSPQPLLVDCDGVRVAGTASVSSQLHAPDWEPPEGVAVQNKATDLYKLGLLFLRIMAPGEFGSTNRDPSRADQVLDSTGGSLLRASLGPPANRPEPKVWYRYWKARDDAFQLGDLGHAVAGTRPRPVGWTRDSAGRWQRSGS